MKYLVIYHSTKHKNTEKLLINVKKILSENITLELCYLDKSNLEEYLIKDFSQYDVVFFASGIYASSMARIFNKFIEKINIQNLPKYFSIIYTAGLEKDNLANKLIEKINEKGLIFKGQFNCLGFDTFGPLLLIGGINKGHPNENDVLNLKDFIETI